MNIPSLETCEKDEMLRHQLSELKGLLLYASKNSAFYKRHFKKYNIDIDDMVSMADLTKIPPIDKTDLQRYQKEFWCVSEKDIVEYCNTSGTEGAAVNVPLTEGDIRRLAYNEAISLACTGGSPEEIYQLTTTIDRQFMAGYAYALGARELGAGMIRVGPGLPQLQWKTILELKPTALIIVPSFLIKLIDFAIQNDINYLQSSIIKAICIGEPIRNKDFSLNAMGRRISEKWNIELYSTYASTEMATAFTECTCRQGGHLHPELVIAEILDESNKPVVPGTVGELTITTLGVEALPLIRFKTGDLCSLIDRPCACGRNTPRLSPIVGRKNQLIKYKGTTCYPSAIFDLLDSRKDIQYYQIVISSDEYGNDELEVKYCTNANKNKKSLINQFKTLLRVTPKLQKMTEQELLPEVFPESSRKPVKFLDLR